MNNNDFRGNELLLDRSKSVRTMRMVTRLRRGESISLQLRIPRIRELELHQLSLRLTVRKRDSYCWPCFIRDRANARRLVRDHQIYNCDSNRRSIDNLTLTDKCTAVKQSHTLPFIPSFQRSTIFHDPNIVARSTDQSAFSQNRAFVTLAPFISNLSFP